ncbi:MAG: chemotaxis response regulator protein-glutamate methylesterase [Deltaproteobacteria bacterium]|nr:chemotaxis response regulator protein-glutamate methylesterase [Deltaproteobacteria bacterium]
MSEKVKVIIVDDSAVVRSILQKGFSKDSRIEVLGTAGDAYEARDMIIELKPDIITLDLNMPRMNGLEFISVLMKHWPIPIIVISSLLNDNRELCIKALELGAIDLFPKPQYDVANRLPKVISQLCDMLYHGAKARLQQKSSSLMVKHQLTSSLATGKVIVIGASTGGTEAIRHVLEGLPGTIPGIVIVQHMPEGFTKSFADRLNQICLELDVKEAENGDILRNGLVLIAPGDNHMLLKKQGSQYFVEVKKGPLVNRHRPSVDVIFHSAAECAGKNAIGVILTGMGADGAKGMLEMRNSGALTIAQDEASCVVYGMPKEAVENGGAGKVVSLDKIPSTLIEMLKS